MHWAFRILAALNAILLATSFLYEAPGEDHAGAGLRMGYAIAYAIALAILLLLYVLAKAPRMRAVIVGALAVPMLVVAYGILLSA